MSVTRYDMNIDQPCNPSMKAFKDGAYVLATDYEASEKARETAEADAKGWEKNARVMKVVADKVEADRDRLQARCDALESDLRSIAQSYRYLHPDVSRRIDGILSVTPSPKEAMDA